MTRKHTTLIGLLILASLLSAGCGAGKPALEAGSVTFDVALVEIKGATAGIPAPELNPSELSAGYRFKAPGEFDAENPERWEVSSYMFSPAAMTVVQGDKVTLRVFGINGDEHALWVEAPDGKTVEGTELKINRGREAELAFTANQAGYYRLVCGTHAPTMQSVILALPAS